MVGPASMLSVASAVPGILQAAAGNPNQPPGLGLAPGEARSFSARLIVERISVRMTSVTQAAPEQDVFSPLDISPEATAGRIFSFSISLFGVYQAQNPDESIESALASFEQLVRDAIDEGFGEARSILDELGRLDAETAEFVDTTYSVLDRLLDEFFRQGEASEESRVGESHLAVFELEYQYLEVQAMMASRGPASGADSLSARFTRVYAESLSVSLRQGELASVPALQLIA